MTTNAEQNFLLLVQEHQGIIRKVCHLYGRNDADRDDLYQEITGHLLAMLKAAFDGIADAGVVEDDSSFRHEVRIGETTTDPHVVIEVMERMPA